MGPAPFETVSHCCGFPTFASRPAPLGVVVLPTAASLIFVKYGDVPSLRLGYYGDNLSSDCVELVEKRLYFVYFLAVFPEFKNLVGVGHSVSIIERPRK